MTVKQMETLKAAEIKKLEVLEQIVKILADLKDEDTVEWVMDKLNDE